MVQARMQASAGWSPVVRGATPRKQGSTKETGSRWATGREARAIRGILPWNRCARPGLSRAPQRATSGRDAMYRNSSLLLQQPYALARRLLGRASRDDRQTPMIQPSRKLPPRGAGRMRSAVSSTPGTERSPHSASGTASSRGAALSSGQDGPDPARSLTWPREVQRDARPGSQGASNPSR